MKREKLRLCGKLFWKFLKIGAFTFGGGYAMIPLIRREIALHEHWLDEGEILDILAVSESTPGPIAVNTATFVGYRVAGKLGAAVSTFGVVLPSFVIIYLLSFVLRQFQELEAVRYAFWGCGWRWCPWWPAPWSPWCASARETGPRTCWRGRPFCWWPWPGPIPSWYCWAAPWRAWRPPGGR